MILMMWACWGGTPQDSATDTAPTEQGDGLDELSASDIPQGTSPCREPELAALESVVDGDTAWFTTGRGSELVRFIGIDTPEVGWDGDPSECFADESTVRVEEVLSGGRAWLSFDAECQDHYDRTLAYIHIGLGEQGFVQRSLLQGGFATAFEVEPNTSFASDFTSDESQAESADIGLWGSCAK
jgi:micrococcal nuclease